MVIEKTIFNVFDGDTLFMTGTEEEVKKRLGIKVKKLAQYVSKGIMIKKRYRLDYKQRAVTGRQYEVWKDNVYLFTADRNGIMDRLGIFFTGSPSSYAFSNSKLQGYTIKIPGNDMEKTADNKTKTRKYKNHLNYLVKHLTEYGNTVSVKDPEPWLEELKQMGLECNVRKRKDKHEGMGRTKAKDIFYILELKHERDN